MRQPDHTRIDLIDALRGFALLGIIAVHFMEQYLGNMPPEEFSDYSRLGVLDTVLEVLAFVFIRGKGFALFSFMFGLSFALQMQRAEMKNSTGDFRPRFVWRLLLLFVIGVGHSAIYGGDILRLYGLLGIPLVFFYRVPNRWLLVVILILTLGFPRVVMHYAFPTPTAEALQAQQTAMQEQAQTGWDLVKHGPMPAMMARNLTEGLPFMMKFQFGPFARGYQTFAYFLIGLWVGRRGLFQDPAACRTLLKRTLRGSIALTLLLPILAAIVAGIVIGYHGGGDSADVLQPPDQGSAAAMPDLRSWPFVIGLAAYDLWNLAMTLGIIAVFVLLWQRPRWQRALGRFAPVGRTALTCYVMQSVLGMMVFSSLGLGLLGDIGNSITLPIGMGLFGLQMWASHFWLKRFRYGPLEWLWRSLTWLQVQPFRRDPVPH